MSDRLKNDNRISLAIACECDVRSGIKKEIEGIVYYVIPRKKNNHEEWKKAIEDFQPVLIHEYGTEKKHNLVVLDCAKHIPVLVSLQGILKEYEKHYYAGIDMSTILRYTPIRDLIRPSGFLRGRLDFKNRSKNEELLLKKVKYVEGRSTWDRVSALSINGNLRYYYCPRMIRRSFYSEEAWNVDRIRRHTILVSQGDYPIKGLHFAFMALALLKDKYPDVRLVVTGNDMFTSAKGFKRFFATGYHRYLYDLSQKLGIRDNIEFVGYKNSEQMANLLKGVHIANIPSSIENAPNSLAEAMLVGTPVVASFVGGNMDMIEHNREGFLYCYNEPNMLAEYISRIFDSDELAMQISTKARDRARDRHDPSKLVDLLVNIYLDIVNDEK